MQQLTEGVDEKPPANMQAGDDDAALKNQNPRPAVEGNLPAIVPAARARNVRRLRFSIGLFAILFAAGGAGFYWWKHSQSQLPAGISWGNGRLEADEIDIDTKFPGRIAELNADIGDMVSAGQVVARMDTRDLQELLKKAQAQIKQAQRAIDEAKANLEQQRTQQTLAVQELDRTQALLKNGWATKELFDQRKQALDAANAGLRAATERVSETERALEASEHDAGLLYRQYQRQRSGGAARRPDLISNCQYRRGASGGRQGVHDAGHLICLYGHLPAGPGIREDQGRHRRPHLA